MVEFIAGQQVPGARSTYTIERKLGEGGFGVAFLATDAGGRAVVLKQLQVARLEAWKAMELFEREARVLASLDHPNIPRYHEFFAADGEHSVRVSDVMDLGAAASLVLVQDHVEGASLQARIDAGERMSAAALERMLRTMLGVLDYLHTLHPPVIHRDIKPANIVVTPEGAPMLVDFGASQDRMRRESELGSTSVGTFGYFPMEQVLGKARPASDLYALGMTMMVALTHRAPEDLPLDPGTSKVLVAAAAPGLGDRFAQLLSAMLEPAIGQRIASAADALRALDGAALVTPSSVVPAPRRGPMRALEWRLPLWGGGLGAALVYTVFGGSLSETDMVQLSYVWVPLVGFGLAGRLTGARKTAIVWALLALFGLLVFFQVVFPML